MLLTLFMTKGIWPSKQLLQNSVLISSYSYSHSYSSFSVINRLNYSTTAGNMKKALIFGNGYVSAPVIEYLNRDPNIQVTVASRSKLPIQRPRVEAVNFNVASGDSKSLGELISKNDVVVSLLPYVLHPKVAAECIKQKVHLVTASYLSPDMAKLDQAAKDAGVTVVNECGLDPGIDHFLAIECFDKIRSKGGQIESFVSFCGGLPAPEYSDNPLRYKFSWSPRGVLLNSLSGAKYLKDDQVIDIPPGGSLLTSTEPKSFLPEFNLEGFPNRDSTIYKELYEIPHAKTILRGTLRFKGFSNAMKALQKLKLIDPNTNGLFVATMQRQLTWKQVICMLLNVDVNTKTEQLKSVLLKEFDGDQDKVDAIVGLGLIDESGEPVEKNGSALDSLSTYLAKRLAFGPTERDLIVLRHEIIAKYPQNNDKRELYEIDMIMYGDPKGYSAMAKTTGYPAAIAAKMVLDGQITDKGMVLPFKQHIYQPMLELLYKEGIQVQEKSSFV